MPRFCESNQAPRIFFCGCLALLLLTAGCQQAQPDTRAADESAIKDLGVQWSKAAGTNNADQVVAYYSDDVVMLAPNAPIINGKAAARTAWAQFMASPGFSLSWESTKVEAARSGDVAYDIGAYQLAMNDPQGKPITDRGKFLAVWKKQADGKWKAAVDMFSSDLPLPAPPPAPEKRKK